MSNMNKERRQIARYNDRRALRFVSRAAALTILVYHLIAFALAFISARM